MSQMNNTDIKYKGNVIVKAVKGNKVKVLREVHNAGNQPLFEFLNNCLIESYDNSLVPKYITAYNDNNQQILQPYPLSQAKLTSTGKVQYSFTVPSTSFGSGTFTIASFKLYCSYYFGVANKWSAEVDLDTELQLDVNSQDALIIEWTLSLSSQD